MLIWLPLLAVLALPAAQVQTQAQRAGLTLLRAMPLGLRSATTCYRIPADGRSLMLSALYRVKRFTCLPPHSRGVLQDITATAQLIIQTQGAAPTLRGRLRLTSRSPPPSTT